MRYIKEYLVTHQKGTISIENWPAGMAESSGFMKGDLGVQVAEDGRVWICIDGAAFLRFKPDIVKE